MSEIQHWDDRYRTNDIPWDTGHVSSELVRVLEQENILPCSAFDLGCGTGSNVLYLAEKGFEVTGIDFSPTAIERARARLAAAELKAHLLVGDVLSPPPDIGGPYELVFDRGCYHVVRRIDVTGYLRTLEQITRTGSIALILAGNANEVREKGPPVVTEDELRGELGKLFQIVHLQEFRFDPIPGTDFIPLGWSCLMRRG